MLRTRLACAASGLVCTGLLTIDLSAQVRHPGEPLADRIGLSRALPRFDLPATQIARLRLEDEQRNHWPLRYGEVVPAHLDFLQLARVDFDPASGALIARMALRSSGACFPGSPISSFSRGTRILNSFTPSSGGGPPSSPNGFSISSLTSGGVRRRFSMSSRTLARYS